MIRLFYLIYILFYTTSVLANVTNLRIIVHEEPIAVPTTKFFNRQDKAISLYDYNHLKLISFWATWCMFCKDKIHELDILQEKFSNQKLTILPISIDFQGVKTVAKFYQQKNIKNLPILLDKNNILANNMNVTSLPTYILVDHNNKEVLRITGNVNWLKDNKIKDIIKKYAISNTID